MGNPVEALVAGIQDPAGVRATAKITANTRVSATTGTIGIATDVLQFPGPNIAGNWLFPATRVRIQGIPVINAASAGVAIAPGPPPAPSGPLTVAQPDQRVKAL
jgi:hypothetical protein